MCELLYGMSNREREYRRFNANRMGILEREAFINDLLFEEDENEDEDPFADDDDEDRDPNYLPLPECNQNDFDDEDEMIGDNVLPDASVGMGIEIEDEADDDADVLEYDEIENEIEDNIHMNAAVSGGHYHARTGRVWDKQPMVAPSARTQACNVFRPPISPGPLIHLKSLTLLNIFNRVFTADLKNDIIKWTNARAEHCYNLANAANRATRHWKPFCLSELDAFFGCLLYVGAMRDGHRRLKTLWSPQEGHVILRAAMSLTRFEMIQRFMRFDDSIGRRSQPHSNRTLPLLHPIGQLMDIINRNLASIYQPYENVTIDEQLKGFRGRCKFRQYMPAKPSKYGLKFWWITDSKSSFPLKCDIYTGAETSATDHGRAYDVVNSLMEKYINAGRNLTIDNYFTSVDLAQHLLAKRTTIVGTLRKNKRDIPKPFVVKEELDDDMTPLKNNGRKVYRTVNSSLFGFSDGMALCSYVPKPNKCVVLLSTQHSTNVDVSGPQNKPQMILDYNKTKGGVDVFDQLVSTYSCSRMTRRWPMVVFYNFLDVAALAAVLIYRHWHPPTKNVNRFRSEKLIELAKQLMDSEIITRQTCERNTVGKSAIEAFYILGYNEPVLCPSLEERLPRKKARCHLCPRSADRKTGITCDVCQRTFAVHII